MVAEVQPEDEDGVTNSVINNDEVCPQNSQIDKTDTRDEEKSEKSKVKSTKKNKPAKTKNEGNRNGGMLQWVFYLHHLASIPVIYSLNIMVVYLSIYEKSAVNLILPTLQLFC